MFKRLPGIGIQFKTYSNESTLRTWAGKRGGRGSQQVAQSRLYRLYLLRTEKRKYTGVLFSLLGSLGTTGSWKKRQ